MDSRDHQFFSHFTETVGFAVVLGFGVLLEAVSKPAHRRGRLQDDIGLARGFARVQAHKEPTVYAGPTGLLEHC